MGRLVMKLTSDVKALIGTVLELTNQGCAPKEVAQQIGKSTGFVRTMLRRLPELIRQMENVK